MKMIVRLTARMASLKSSIFSNSDSVKSNGILSSSILQSRLLASDSGDSCRSRYFLGGYSDFFIERRKKIDEHFSAIKKQLNIYKQYDPYSRAYGSAGWLNKNLELGLFNDGYPDTADIGQEIYLVYPFGSNKFIERALFKHLEDKQYTQIRSAIQNYVLFVSEKNKEIADIFEADNRKYTDAVKKTSDKAVSEANTKFTTLKIEFDELFDEIETYGSLHGKCEFEQRRKWLRL